MRSWRGIPSVARGPNEADVLNLRDSGGRALDLFGWDAKRTKRIDLKSGTNLGQECGAALEVKIHRCQPRQNVHEPVGIIGWP